MFDWTFICHGQHDHVNWIDTNVVKKLNHFWTIKCCLTLHTRKIFSNSFISQVFGYCGIIWGNRSNDIAMMSLQILQNKAAKEILDRPSAGLTMEHLGQVPQGLNIIGASHAESFHKTVIIIA